MRMIDRVARGAFELGIGTRGTALLETVGRKTGQPRVTPLTNGIDGDDFWIVTEHGTRSDYVRNLIAEPRVRVKVGRRWRSGVAAILDEDPEERLRLIAERNPRARTNTKVVRRMGSEHVVIRIALDGEA